MDERNYEVLVADDHKFVHRLGLTAPEELEKVKGSKILVLNALRRKEHLSHLTIDEAIQIINFIKPEQAYLTHFSHVLGKQADVEKTLPNNVFMAYDGLVLEV